MIQRPIYGTQHRKQAELLSRTKLVDEIARAEQALADLKSGQTQDSEAPSTLKPPDRGKDVRREPFHVLHLFKPATTTESDPGALVRGLDERLQAAEDYLNSAKGLSYLTKTKYRECNPSTRQSMIDLLARQKGKMEEEQDDTERQEYEERLELAAILDAIYELFVPSEYHGPTCAKFWGATIRILTVRLAP